VSSIIYYLFFVFYLLLFILLLHPLSYIHYPLSHIISSPLFHTIIAHFLFCTLHSLSFVAHHLLSAFHSILYRRSQTFYKTNFFLQIYSIYNSCTHIFYPLTPVVLSLIPYIIFHPISSLPSSVLHSLY